MESDTEGMDALLERAAQGDESAWGELFSLHRDRLRRMVQVRLDRRLHGRVDASDVIQETHLEAIQRFPDYLKKRDMPFFLWLRFLTCQKVVALHRHHLGAQRRDARMEVRLQRGPLPGASSVTLAHQLVGQRTAPSQAAVRAEQRARLEDALNGMDAMDREVLSLRHFEQLTNAEVARELEIDESAASKRYIRALRRLKDILAAMPGGEEL